MPKSVFITITLALGLLFTAAFAVIVMPALIESGDIASAFKAGFVNPFSTGYSLDAIISALILMVWIIYERQALGVKHGWICILLSWFPGVAMAFALYLILRMRTAPTEQS